MSWCTSGVGLQDLSFIDNWLLRSIHPFQRYSCIQCLQLNEFLKVSKRFVALMHEWSSQNLQNILVVIDIVCGSDSYNTFITLKEITGVLKISPS